MELYKNKELFLDTINEVSRELKIDAALIEKDYFVMYLLSELTKEIPGLLFKGGTCCSHAYHAIDRFSEDIDLSLDTKHFGRNHNIKANHKIIEVCDRLGFKILNRSSVEKHLHGSFNRYNIEYPIYNPSNSVKPYVQIEMTFIQKSYPNEIKSINSIIGEWLINSGNKNIAEEFNLLSFNICVQKLERTFIDKVFALCDYYERKASTRNSRHIYDLYKISKIIDLTNDDLINLIKEVRSNRKKNPTCLSAQDGYDVNSSLRIIVDNGYFKSDYNNITMNLLTKQVAYDEAIEVLNRIINSNIFKS